MDQCELVIGIFLVLSKVFDTVDHDIFHSFGALLLLVNINDLTTVTTTSLSVLFADDNNIVLSDKKIAFDADDIKWADNHHILMVLL